MDIKNELEFWKGRLLDLSKRNNLINFKDTKSTTIEIVYPSLEDVFKRITETPFVQFYDDDLDDDYDEENNKFLELDKDEYISRYSHKVKNRILGFNKYKPTYRVLKNLEKRANESITERGVNILFLAFGLVKWKEDKFSSITYNAPLLMVPVVLTRKSSASHYQMVHFDEDVSLNMSFAYMLKKDHNIELPEFDDQNINDYFDQVEEIFKKMNWQLIREVRLATFAFNKLSMYMDLDENSKKISENENVSILTNSEINNQHEINPNPDFFDEHDISNKADLFLEQHNVVDADFSQTEAIEYANSGKSFVLQGPPGTGKSQTITNIIAELIYNKKKVLFVSEKMAALEVVYNNLKKVNLDEFCLQLHSYKANKKDFVEDLYKTLSKEKTLLKKDSEYNLEETKKIVSKLNRYDAELYKLVKPINKTLYQLLASTNHYRNFDKVKYVVKGVESYNRDKLNETVSLIRKFAKYENVIGYNYKHHKLYGLVIQETSDVFVNEFEENLKHINKSFSDFLSILNDTENKTRILLRTNNDVDFFIKFYDFLLDNGFDNKNIFDDQYLIEIINNISNLERYASNVNACAKRIDEKYIVDFYEECEVDELLKTFKEKGNNFFKRAFNSEYKLAKRKLAKFKKFNKKISYYEGVDDLEDLKKWKKNISKFNELATSLNISKVSKFKGLNTDWSELKNKLCRLHDGLFVNQLSNGVYLAPIKLFEEKDDFYKLKTSFNMIKGNESKIKPYIDANIVSSKDTFDKRNIMYKNYLDNMDLLDSWVDFLRTMHDIKSYGLNEFIDIALEENIHQVDFENSFLYCFYKQLTDKVINNNQFLLKYNKADHELDVNSFGSNDKKQLKISIAAIKEKLSEIRPSEMNQVPNSPAAVIRKEHEKKRKIKPIRVMMKEIGDFIQEIKPCFLMSPLSVSTYLSENMEFDTIIFDEASQVFPEDAIVAIYRGKQIIVVGDSKQMPPTKFFMSSDNDNEDYDDETSSVEGYESILDLCSTSYPTKSLLCHYRSKDESLITFSNKNFYNFNLCTYPSVIEESNDSGVKFDYVKDGVIGKNSINIKEAERVVELIYQHFKKYPNRSLGVVAFNIKQQDLIYKLLEKRRKNDPILEEYFSTDKEEPFFIKNLETVQGDERDTIIFSVTYAKNNDGVFAHRFGPLNNQGGERRLNVAITRAKISVIVVSSIKSHDIDISRVANKGPKLLHDYLDYAENGVSALARAINVSDKDEFDSPFEEDVCNFLKEKGYDVTTQVGCSKYKIDIGLKKPGTSKYVLAIECDGATYHSSKSARDRDRLRQSILEGMNWKFYRIWSTDWFKNNKFEKERLLKACDAALKDEGTNITETNNNEPEEDLNEFAETVSLKEEQNIFDDFRKYTEAPPAQSRINSYLINVLVTEGPISETYFLMKTMRAYHLDSIKLSVRDNIRKAIYEKELDIELKNGFYYLKDQFYFAMRKNLAEPFGDISNVSEYEIRNGMYSAIKANGTVQKDQLYYFIRKSLGFAKMGNMIEEKFDFAFSLLKGYIVIDENENIRTDENNQLEIIHRK